MRPSPVRMYYLRSADSLAGAITTGRAPVKPSKWIRPKLSRGRDGRGTVYDRTVTEVGAMVGMTGAGVSLLERRFAKKMRKTLADADKAGEIDLGSDSAGREFFLALVGAFKTAETRKNALSVRALPIR